MARSYNLTYLETQTILCKCYKKNRIQYKCICFHLTLLEICDFLYKIVFMPNLFKGVGVVIWYLSIPPHNNSRAVVKNLRILVYRSSLRLTIPYLKLNIVTSHHQVVSLF